MEKRDEYSKVLGRKNTRSLSLTTTKTLSCKTCLHAKKTNAFTEGTSNFRKSTLMLRALINKDAILKLTMKNSITKAIKSAIEEKEKGIGIALKVTYWLAKEGIVTNKYSSLLSLKLQINTHRVVVYCHYLVLKILLGGP